MKNKKQLDLNKNLFIGILLAVCTGFTHQPAKALIPYVYEPNPYAIKNTSLSIGQTAAQFLKIGQPKEAARLAALAVRLQPKNDKLWSLLAEAQLRSNELKSASHSLSIAKKLNPQEALLWFAEASLALQKKDANTAIELLTHGLELDAKNSGAYFQLGNARIMQSEFKLALKAFKNASNLNATFWEAINNQAIVLFETGKTQEAIKTWRHVLTINENAEPMLALAAALHAIKPDSPEAIELAQKALSKNPNYVSTTYQQEQLWGNKLREATSRLLTKDELVSTVERAEANSDQ